MIVPRGRPIRQMWKFTSIPLLLLLGYDFAVVVCYQVLHWRWLALAHIPVALLGSAIGIVLGFRNQSSYARWWEGRILWGAIVNNSRSWGRQVTTSMAPSSAEDAAALAEMQKHLVYLQIGYVHALRQHLRGLEPWTEVSAVLSEAEVETLRGEKNIPTAIQQTMGRLLRECQRRGWIDPMHWLALDQSLNDLSDAQGGAERIKNTPMPKQYDYFPRLFVRGFCILLPLALVPNLGWFTPLGSTLAGFIFLGLDEIGRDLEDPFENSVFDVPLTSITTTIETNLRQMLGETTLPEPAKPIHGVIW